ncbi:hypothetical protein CA51_16950 [Rosistilla oblonga]|uniref:hypothetical protein n=1 Tax=Rosistilla oblonga TaxID=2527990 RepID=UPI00118A0451|nr:hypothetical protein [Rosistilla oblonga]QDV11819.1 hypothetical protein CA51_16950 [Rosistilla oblonga]
MRFLIASMMLVSLIVLSTGCVCGPGGYPLCDSGPGYASGCDSCGPGGCEPSCGFDGGYMEPACGIDGGCGEPSCGCGPAACNSCCINPCAFVCGFLRDIGSCIFGGGGCQSGCGSLYIDEWASCPPACNDPCNNHGQYVGGGGCGCGGGCDGGGGVAPVHGRGLASIWGFKYMGGSSCGGGGCGDGCGCTAGSCGSYASGGSCGSGGCGCQSQSYNVGYSHGGYSHGEIIREQGPSLQPQIMEHQTVPHAVEQPADTLPQPKVSQTSSQNKSARLVRPSQPTSYIRR